MKKLLNLALVLVIGLSFTACVKENTITLTISNTDITVIEGDAYTILFSTNDTNNPIFSSSNEDVLTVDELGVVRTLSEGEATVTVTSKADSFLIIEVDFNVRKLINLSSELDSITLTEEDTHLVVISSNDEYIFSSSNTSIFVVDENGLITAKEEGTADLIVTSTYDDTYEIKISIIVEKIIEISATESNYVLVVGDLDTIEVTSNDDFTFESRNPDVASVNEDGNVEALKFGEAIIRVISVSDPTVFIEVNFDVYKFTEEIVIEGINLLIVGTNGQLTIDPSPVGAFMGVIWESANADIVTIDEFGVLTGVGAGTTSITATSSIDSSVVAVYDVEVINMIIVDSTVGVGDTYNYDGLELTFGTNLYSEISSAIESASIGTIIYIEEGNYSGDVLIDVDGIILEGLTNVTFEGNIDVSGNNVTIKNINFTGVSSIDNTITIDNFIFENNNADNISLLTGAFIDLYGVSNIYIENNTFSNINVDAINISNFISGSILIKNNLINDALNGIVIDAVYEYDITTEINVVRNSISNVDVGINIDLLYGTEQKQIEAYARFNAVSLYTFGASSNIGNQVDFTLNYWGTETIDYLKFVNIEEAMLRGYYVLESDIISEELYNPLYPLLIEITNPITEMTIGDFHTIEFDVFPLNLDGTVTRFIISNPEVLMINLAGELTPVRSGTCTVTIRSAIDSSINTTMTVNVITLPGIELSLTDVENNNSVGSTFTLNATPFPITLVDEAVNYHSSNIEVATIDSSGLVTSTGEGIVTLTASLVSDPTVTQTFTMNVYGTLDENNLLDYLTMNQVTYSTVHSWTAYGFAYNYFDTRYESVSRYYFDNVVINDLKIVPVSYGIRPGEPMDPLPDDVTHYNDDDVYWVVVHDTASTGTGSGALAHANYLYNNAMIGNTLWVSWHYTIDDTYIYQSLPEDERGYHAGDGSTQPLQGTTYLGGGNRNGIGIEMAINDDGDMYRTWQRTAKLVVDILTRHNLPRENQTYHNDFSGKDCPNTLRNAGLIPLFETFVDVEYKIKTEHPNAQITFTSNNLEYLDDHGRIIAMPDEAITVSYTITVIEDGVTESRTFYTYLPGTIH